jgi:hypothetical protein
LFMTYRMKARNVTAEQITLDNIEEIAQTFNGTARVLRNGDEIELNIATLDGLLKGVPDQWIVRTDGGLEMMSDKDFNDMYERARNFRDGQ